MFDCMSSEVRSEAISNVKAFACTDTVKIYIKNRISLQGSRSSTF